MPAVAPVYPVGLMLEGRPCLVVGGGRVAARKVEGLVACGAGVHVVAPTVTEAIRSRPGVTFDERPYRPGEAAGYTLVFSATGVPEVDRQVGEDTRAAGVWFNSAADPASGSFVVPSVLRRGGLAVAVSTGGRSPGLAAWLRRRLEGEVGPEYAALVDLVSAAREAVKAEGRSPGEVDWQEALESGILDLIRKGRVTEAKERLRACLS
jgi:precorrin-2 dehydrogenase/sirohydrochlorin ferrochelatase